MLGRVGIVSLRGQRELTDPLVLLGIAVVLVAYGQGVVLGERIVDSRGKVGSMPGKRHRLDERSLSESSGIKRNSVDGREIVDIAALEVEEE